MGEIAHLIGELEQVVREHGAVAVMIIIFLETLGAPVPGESLLIFASALAARGELSWHTLYLGAWVGAVAGDNIGFVVGRYAGRTLILRYGTKIGLTAARLEKVENYFRRYGPLTVVVARFIAYARQLNGPVAGALEMKWRRFIVFDLIGATLWVSVWMLVGAFIGEHAASLISIARRFWPVLLILAGLALIVAFAVRAHQRRKRVD